MLAEFGGSHRLFLGPTFGSLGVAHAWDADDRDLCAAAGTTLGPSGVVGYKGTARFGLLVLAYLGASWGFEPGATQGWLGPAFGLGLGYKF